MKIIRSIPALFYIVAVYNVLAFLGGTILDANVWKINLISGAEWSLTGNHLLLVLAIILLYIEIFKATRTSSASIADHALSMALFVACLVEFIVLRQMGNSVFFIITLICLLDVVAGFTITISTARRDFGVGSHALDG